MASAQHIILWGESWCFEGAIQDLLCDIYWSSCLCAGRYDRIMLGIFPVGDLTKVVMDCKAEVVILEEPEHLTWFHHGPRWTKCFDHVVSHLILFTLKRQF